MNAETVEELEERVRNGDTSITAAALAKARDAAHLAALQDVAAERSRLAEEAAGRHAEVERVRADVVRPFVQRRADLSAEYERAVAAVRNLEDSLASWRGEHPAVLEEAQAAGLAAEVPEQLPPIGNLSTAIIRDATGSPMFFKVQGGLKRLQSHALHSPEYIAATNERFEAEHNNQIARHEAERQASIQRHAREEAELQARRLERARDPRWNPGGMPSGSVL